MSRRPVVVVDPPFEYWPMNGLLCSTCAKPQRATSSGATCGEHGGAEGIEPPKTPVVRRAKAGAKDVFRSTVEHVEVEATKLITIDAKHAWWGDTKMIGWKYVDGAIVRLRPPADTDPALVEHVRTNCLKHGAVAVKVTSPRRSAVVPQEARTSVERKSAREVVKELVEASSYADRPALLARVERRLSEARL